MAKSWRVVTICSIVPLAHSLIDKLRELGHEPVALLAPRREREHEPPPHLILTDATAPQGIDLLLARDKHSIEPLLRAYEPDLMLCWGFPWKIPQSALDVPRLASVNCHPALLPRHRGPIPLAWALRDGDDAWGCTWHYMDAELDTGNTLVQGTVPIEDDDVDIAEFSAKLQANAVSLLPRALERVAAGDPGRRAADRGSELGGALRGRRLRPRRLERVGALDPQSGAGLAPHVRHVRAARAGRRPRRRAARPPADAAHRSWWRCAPRGVRRRPDLDRRQRARLALRPRRRPSA